MNEVVDLTKEHIDLFFNEFNYWQGYFGLNHLEVYFSTNELKDVYATINYDTNGVSFLQLNSKIQIGGVRSIEEQLKSTAKHEAIHLLLGDFSAYANTRCVSEGELNDAEEILVRRLMKLI